MHVRWGVGAVTVCLSMLTGCGQRALVKSDLPIVRVVVYRNGVAYFERAGHVDKDRVSFKMKQEEVGDFLATLAVMEQGDSSVRSAAFPLKMDDDDAKPGKKTDPAHALRTVTLALDGRSHDLQVGYVAAAPVWRPTYRLVMQANGQASLQGWGIVENLSGEDWTDVKLALVAGAPIAFDAQLGTPVIPERPIVTDQGEVIVAVPKSETSVEQEKDMDHDGVPDTADAPAPVAKSAAADPSPVPGTPPPPPPSVQAQQMEGRLKGEGAGAAATGADFRKEAPRRTTTPGYVQPSATRNVKSLAAVATQGGNHAYEMPTAITVPDKSATMVLLLEQRVRGESIFLFAPDDGIPDSSGHPFHVARFTNGTVGTLERGPIAVFQQGAFLGQGMVDPTAPGATTTVPFALERAIGVTKHTKTDVQGSRLSKIENGALWLEHDYVLKTIYDIENGGNEVAKILVKHPRSSETRLFQPPTGTEDNLGSGSALVPGTVAAHGKQSIVVDERSATAEYSDWFSEAANTAITAYIADSHSNKDVVQKLTAAWPTRALIVAETDQRQKLQGEMSALAEEAQEKRSDLRAIEKNKTAEALRKRLTDRLAAIAARQDTLTAQFIQVGQELSEVGIAWREAIRSIKLTEVPAPKP
jgi:hypothetical protein